MKTVQTFDDLSRRLQVTNNALEEHERMSGHKLPPIFLRSNDPGSGWLGAECYFLRVKDNRGGEDMIDLDKEACEQIYTILWKYLQKKKQDIEEIIHSL